MSENDLIPKIKKLKGIEPSSEWLVSARRNLLEQINFGQRFEQRAVSPDFSFNWLKELRALAVVVFVGLFFLAGPWLTATASKGSLPGEILYPVKKLTERAQTILASNNSKAQLEVNFAARRIAELNKITETSASEQERAEKTREIINQFKDNLAGASIHAEALSKENALAAAKKTIIMKKDLIELTQTSKESSLEVKADLAEAGKKIEEINNKILAVLTKEDKENTLETENNILDQEILIFIDQNLKTETTTPVLIIPQTLPISPEPISPEPESPSSDNSTTSPLPVIPAR